MESIATNLGKPERRTLNGRSYLVAPATLIVSGRVLEGNQGPGLYPAEEVERRPHIWNKMPLVLWHPRDDAGYVTARDPEVIAAQGIGDVYAAEVADGKLVVQAWFDEALVKHRDEQYKLGRHAVYPRLLRGEPIELSTGLFPSYDRTPGVAENGQRYEWIARDIDADHVAILPDEVGACSNEDGCGVNNRRSLFGKIVAQVAKALGINQNPSDEIGPEKACQILEDGEANGQPLTEAQRGMFGAACGKTDNELLEQIAANVNGELDMATKTFDRKRAIADVHNCSCLGKAWPLEVLNKLSDDQLRPLAENARMLIVVNGAKGPRVTNDVAHAWPKLSANQRRTAVKLCDVRRLVANQDEEMEAAGVDIAGLAEFLGIAADPASDPVGFVNELKGKLDEISAKLGIAAPPPAPEPEASSLNEEDEDRKKDEEMAAYSRTPVAQPVKNRLTPEEQEDLAYARFHRRKARQAMIERLTGNAKDPAKSAKVFDRMTDAQLQTLVEQLPAVNRRGPEDEEGGDDDRPSFFFGGNGGGAFGGSALAGNRRRLDDDEEPTEDERAVVNLMTPQRPAWGKKREKAKP